jgi:hypothetical protein
MSWMGFSASDIGCMHRAMRSLEHRQHPCQTRFLCRCLISAFEPTLRPQSLSIRGHSIGPVNWCRNRQRGKVGSCQRDRRLSTDERHQLHGDSQLKVPGTGWRQLSNPQEPKRALDKLLLWPTASSSSSSLTRPVWERLSSPHVFPAQR